MSQANAVIERTLYRAPWILQNPGASLLLLSAPKSSAAAQRFDAVSKAELKKQLRANAHLQLYLFNTIYGAPSASNQPAWRDISHATPSQGGQLLSASLVECSHTARASPRRRNIGNHSCVLWQRGPRFKFECLSAPERPPIEVTNQTQQLLDYEVALVRHAPIHVHNDAWGLSLMLVRTSFVIRVFSGPASKPN